MKQLFFTFSLVVSTALLANAQDKTSTVTKEEKTTKKTSTVPQKVHNTFSKHKHYSGKKTVEKKVTEHQNQ